MRRLISVTRASPDRPWPAASASSWRPALLSALGEQAEEEVGLGVERRVHVTLLVKPASRATWSRLAAWKPSRSKTRSRGGEDPLAGARL